MGRARTTALFLILLAGLPGTAGAGDSFTDPYPGIRHLRRTTATPPLDLHALVIDLSYTEHEPFFTGSADRGHTVSEFASLYDLQVAWNGDLFRPLGFVPEGFAMGGHTGLVAAWPDTAEQAGAPYLALVRDVSTRAFLR